MAREDDIRKIVAGGRSRGLSDDQIRALVARYDERTADVTPPQAPAAPSAPAGGMLPTAGALVGSTIGTVGALPGRIAGAAVGGALGKGAELFMDEKDDSLMDSLKAMGTEGAKQGGFELAGGAAGKALRSVGGGLYRVALRPSKTLQQEFPNVIQTGMREGLAVSRKGAEKAAARTAASATKADDLIAAAEQVGTAPVRPMDVIRELRPVASTLRNRAAIGLPDETPALVQRSKSLIAAHPRGIPLTKAQTLKREAQDMADTAFRAQEKGAVIKDDVMLANKAVAKGLRKGIEARVPDVAPVNQRTRDLMGVTKALEDAQTRNLVFDRLVGGGAGMASGMAAGQGDVGTGMVGAGLAAGAVSPALLSRLGLLANRAGGVAAFTPQAIRAAMLLSQLSAEGPGEGQ